MKTKIAFLLTLALIFSLLAGCAGTAVVYYGDCTCPSDGQPVVTPTGNTGNTGTEEGAVKTGLSAITSLSGSTDAAEGTNGQIKYDVTLVAVTVDDNGVIDSCVIDSVPATVHFDAQGLILTELMTDILTKNELGEDYGMKLYGGSKHEWNEQVAALAKYAEGKTVAELKSGAINESGMAADADLASTATIYLGGYVAGIEAAVANAQHLGAQKGDELRLATISSTKSSVSATADKAGTAQLDSDITALTMADGVITSCVIDSVQAKVSVDATGKITSDLTAAVPTKNELGESYGMKLYAGSKYEWNEQAAAFAKYVTGKTLAEVEGIAVSDSGAPADADLASTVTIYIGGFLSLVAKAAK